MTRRYSIPGTRTGSLGLVIAAVFAAQAVWGQTSYTFVTQSEPTTTVDWHNTAVWNPTGVPNGVGDGATFNRPTVTPSVPFSVVLDQNATVGSIRVDNAGFNQNQNLVLDAGGGVLTLQATSGAATWTETAGTATSGRFDVWPNITLNSDLNASLANRADLNSSSFLRGVITGSNSRTITKSGGATWQLEHHGSSGYQGQYTINEGGIRFAGGTNILQSTGVTVNAGGQLQFNATDGGPDFHDWSLAAGAVLNLNGLGRQGLAGALRFQGAAGQQARHSKFMSPVVLQSDTRIGVGPAEVTGELTNAVTGSGGLTKNGPGTLILSNSASSYAGNTAFENNSGTLRLMHPVLSSSADVTFATQTAFLNLDFDGTDQIRSLFIAGQQMAKGLWGADGNPNATHHTPRITGGGLLDVLVGPGLTGDYNENNVVDAADYVVWRNNVGTTNTLPNDPAGGEIGPTQYNNWRANFGNTAAGSGNGGLSAMLVPEPSAMLLAVVGMLVVGGLRRRSV